jgi:hypothetical protein
LIKEERKEDGSTVYEVRGLIVEYLLLSMKKMNMTVEFLRTSLKVSLLKFTEQGTKLTNRMADVVVSICPLLPILINGLTEPSIPYIFDAAKWFVPCPKFKD